MFRFYCAEVMRFTQSGASTDDIDMMTGRE
jgi:hypothetical protein